MSTLRHTCFHTYNLKVGICILQQMFILKKWKPSLKPTSLLLNLTMLLIVLIICENRSQREMRIS